MFHRIISIEDYFKPTLLLPDCSSSSEKQQPLTEDLQLLLHPTKKQVQIHLLLTIQYCATQFKYFIHYLSHKTILKILDTFTTYDAAL